MPSANLEQILTIVPVLNEEATISGAIAALKSFGLNNIRVVDNGSTDNSVAEAKAAGAEVVREPIPGYGRACWRGLQDIDPKIEWILFCDGDGSDDLSQLPEFFAATATFDLILGDRRATREGRSAMTPVQNFGNGLATTLMAWGWGHQYFDLGPLRLIRRWSLAQIQMQDRGFGWTVEMQTRAIECGLRVLEIPVGYRRRQGGRSKISGTLSGSIQAGIIILTTLGRLYLRRLFPRRGEGDKERGGQGEGGTRGKGDSGEVRSSPVFQTLSLYLSAFLLICGAIWIVPHGNLREADAVSSFFVGISIMSAGFAVSWAISAIRPLWFWAIALLTRLLLFPMYPGDDVWRYLWEGQIQNLGFSPYHLAPNAAELLPYRMEWWYSINHPDVSAIYPPLAQLGFRLLASIGTSVLLFKLGFVLADLGVCWLLGRKFGYRKALLYAWNPLVIYSFAGGAHYDSWFVLSLVAAWLAWENCREFKSTVWLGVSVAMKWMSLPILSFLAFPALRQFRFKRAGIIMVLGLLPVLLGALNFCNNQECPLVPTSSVFVSYGRSAEFFPYFVGLAWPRSMEPGWNKIYLILLAFMGLLVLWRSHRFIDFAEWYLFALLTLSPIIHAWYFTWIIPFAVASRNLGTRLVSLSAFVYFVLPYHLAMGKGWMLNPLERYTIWLPFVLGFFWTAWQQKKQRNLDSTTPQSLRNMKSG